MLDAFIGFLIGCALIFFVMASAGQPNPIIIEKGYGLYCPNDGEFAFIGECE